MLTNYKYTVQRNTSPQHQINVLSASIIIDALVKFLRIKNGRKREREKRRFRVARVYCTRELREGSD